MKRIMWLTVAGLLTVSVPQVTAQTGHNGAAGTAHTHAKHGTAKRHGKTARHGTTTQKNRKHARHSTHEHGKNG
jgi:hypothetical protein